MTDQADIQARMESLATTIIPSGLAELQQNQQKLPSLVDYFSKAYRADHQTTRTEVFDSAQQYTHDALVTVGFAMQQVARDLTEFVKLQSYEMEKLTTQVNSLSQRMKSARISAGQQALQAVLSPNVVDQRLPHIQNIPEEKLAEHSKPLPRRTYEKIDITRISISDLATSIHRIPTQPQADDASRAASIEKKPTFLDNSAPSYFRERNESIKLAPLPLSGQTGSAPPPLSGNVAQSFLSDAPPPLSSARPLSVYGSTSFGSLQAPPPLSSATSTPAPPPPLSSPSTPAPPPPLSSPSMPTPPPPLSAPAPPLAPPPLSSSSNAPAAPFAPPPPLSAPPRPSPPPPAIPAGPVKFVPTSTVPTKPQASRYLQLDPSFMTQTMILQNGQCTHGGPDSYSTVLGLDTLTPNTGVHYFEVSVVQTAASMIFVGFWDASDVSFLENYANSNSYTICLSSGERFRNLEQSSFYDHVFSASTTLGLAYDSNEGKIYGYMNGAYHGVAFDGVTGNLRAVITFYNAGDSLTVTPNSFVSA